MRRQRGIPDGRPKAQSYLDPAVKRVVLREAAHFDVSESFVVNVALAEVFGVTLRFDRYQQDQRPDRRRPARRRSR